MSVNEVPELVQQLYAIVGRLEALFPGRKFTLDGHLVGSIGEVLAAHAYELELFESSTAVHDAKASDGKLVQLKATQVNRVSLYSEPEHLIVIRLKRDGSFEQVYNGPGKEPWESAGKMLKNGQRAISCTRLRAMMASTPEANRILRVHW